jgi:DNA-binding MarR family transcriptional regulator
VSTESVIVTAPDEAGADAPAVDVTRLRVALARLARRLRKHELAGLTPTQLAALATVERSGPMRLGDLAAAEGIAPSTLTRLVTALEESDYVRRHADPSDARASTLAITPRGRDTLDRLRTQTTLELAASLRLLTLAQRSALAEALPVLELLAEAPGTDQAGARQLMGGHAPRPLGTNDREVARPGGGPVRHVRR